MIHATLYVLSSDGKSGQSETPCFCGSRRRHSPRYQLIYKHTVIQLNINKEAVFDSSASTKRLFLTPQYQYIIIEGVFDRSISIGNFTARYIAKTGTNRVYCFAAQQQHAEGAHQHQPNAAGTTVEATAG